MENTANKDYLLRALTVANEKTDKIPLDTEIYSAWFDVVRQIGEIDRALSLDWNARLRAKVIAAGRRGTPEATTLVELARKTYLYAAPFKFDDYCIYLEWNRTEQKKFYLPRRKTLLTLVNDLQELYDGKIDFLGISLPARVGKAVAFDTPVLTQNGWKQHGDLTIRDRVVAPNGNFVNVFAIHPVCEMEYEVTFSNNEKIVCHGNHEWQVFNRHRQKMETLETKQMLNDYESNALDQDHRYFYMLPLRDAVIGEQKDLPIKPYTLGVWLGDGRNQNPDICGAERDCNIIVEGVYAEGYPFAWKSAHKTTGVYYYGFRGLRESLQKVGMCHSRRRTEKHIPDIYFTASIEQRLKLLAGLLDTDGTLSKKERRYTYTTNEERLRDDVVALISTFGWRCSVTRYEAGLSSSGIRANKPYWAVSFNPTLHIPCRLERKQLRDYSKQRRVFIINIKPINGKQGNCITVEGGMYCVGRQMIPTHTSTLCIFFMTWLMGNRPDVANVMSGHSDKLTDGFYREVLNIMTDAETYRWADVFPNVRVVNNSAKNETIDLNKEKRFPTFTARSIGGTLTGAVEIGTGGCLYVDDLVEDLEESLNLDRLKSKYDAYLNQLKDRKKEGALELMVGTRWNVFDPLGRVEEQYRDNPRYRFRVIPALNEDGKSNFDYPYQLGFSTEHYLDMKASIDDATWCAKYMGKPYVREGLLFPPEELNYYNGILPDGEPTAILAVCDVAWGGGDSLSMPFAYIFENSIYIHDVVFNQGDKTITRPIVLGKIMIHKPQKVRFEANAGGHEYSNIVDDGLREKGFHTNILARKAPAANKSALGSGKMWRIVQHSPDIRKFIFIDEKHRSKEYQAFMNELCTFSQVGKNAHDDAPDSLAMLADELYHGSARVEVIQRTF